MWMNLSLLCIGALLSIVVADEHKSLILKETSRFKGCDEYMATLIKAYFEGTTVNLDLAPELEFCKLTKRPRRAVDIDEFDLIPIDEIIAYYSGLPQVNNYQNLRVADPMTTYGVLVVNNEEQLPVYINADIRYRHLPGSGSRVHFGADVERQMLLMGQLDTDDRGHLLAHSIGGHSGALNVVPMASNLNRNLALIPLNRNLSMPRSYWRCNEDWILRFLQRYRNGRVTWRIAVQYRDNVIIDPNRFRYYRPVRFSVQYTGYTNQNDNTSVYFESAEMSYLNNQDFACGYHESSRRRRQDEFGAQVFFHKIECKAEYAKKPLGKVGDEKSSGTWQNAYKSAFPFVIDGKQYYFGQIVDGGYWFIQEILPNGQLGDQTDQGNWKLNYPVVFPYSIEGKHFFYGHNPDSQTWFIQELLPGGKMGKETTGGTSTFKHAVCFPYNIDGDYYFYCHSRPDSKGWFIQKLLPNGLIGEITQQGNWGENYPLSFPYHINGRHFFFAQSYDSRIWFIQELLPDGKMGKEKSNGRWSYRYQVCFPFAIKRKQYFQCQSILDDKYWFVQELLPGGKMGETTDSGKWITNYQTQFPFMIDGKSYYFGHSTYTKTWFIQGLK